MKYSIIQIRLFLILVVAGFTSCKLPSLVVKDENKLLPNAYQTSIDSTNLATIKWKTYFKDKYLIALIDTALKNNQELNITMQEIEMSKNEVMARKGEYLPFLHLGAGAAGVKAGK